jgi:uncharacterized protein YfaP (DUF2135 family)
VTVRDLIVSDQATVLINLPNNTDVRFYMAPDYTNAFATINSGAAWGGTGVPASPYDVCNGVATVQDAPEPVAGTLQGQVTDAVSGNPIAGAQVCINGTNLCATADANGNYTIANAPAGDQTLGVTADGYIAVTDQAVTITAGETTERPVALSLELAEGELRIVLEWGADPRDLDSHLFLPDNTDIHYPNKGVTVQGVLLDLDDTDGNGPETITIMEQSDGTYTYAVYKYAGDGTLSTSGAVVRVYRGNQEIDSFRVPTTGEGDWWHVFNLDGNNITEVNTLSTTQPR